jgi:hypothetical protein
VLNSSKETIMFKTVLMAGAVVTFAATAAIAGNSPPIADNFQPFMWAKPQVAGEPMTARDLGMEDRASSAPVYEGRAVSVGDRYDYRSVAGHSARHHRHAQ